MTRFKNLSHDGFSFMEVVLALFVLGTLVSTIFLSLDTTLRTVQHYTNVLDRMHLARKRLFQAWMRRQERQPEGKREQQLEEPPTTLMYSAKPPTNDSPLQPFQHLVLERVEAQWQERGAQETIRLISLFYKPPQSKEGT